jgi:hypothetical protein
MAKHSDSLAKQHAEGAKLQWRPGMRVGTEGAGTALAHPGVAAAASAAVTAAAAVPAGAGARAAAAARRQPRPLLPLLPPPLPRRCHPRAPAPPAAAWPAPLLPSSSQPASPARAAHSAAGARRGRSCKQRRCRDSCRCATCMQGTWPGRIRATAGGGGCDGAPQPGAAASPRAAATLGAGNNCWGQIRQALAPGVQALLGADPCFPEDLAGLEVVC